MSTFPLLNEQNKYPSIIPDDQIQQKSPFKYQKKPKKKVCAYKVISQADMIEIPKSQQYDDYIQKLSTMNSKQHSMSLSIKEEDAEHIIPYKEEDDQADAEKSQQSLNEVLEFLVKSKHNFYSNLINAFKINILYKCTEEQKRFYESLSQDDWSFAHLRKRVYQNLKNCSRHGLKIRNIIENNNMNEVFIHFLRNSDEIWLNNSKIKEKESFRQSIDLILQAYDNRILTKNIQYYKKQRK